MTPGCGGEEEEGVEGAADGRIEAAVVRVGVWGETNEAEVEAVGTGGNGPSGGRAEAAGAGTRIGSGGARMSGG